MHDPIALTVLGLIVLIIALAIGACSIRRYEVSVFLVALSPLIAALFVTNVKGEQVEGIGSYLRVGLLLFAGIVGIIQFFRLRSIVNERLPFHLILLGMFLLLALFSTSYSIDKPYTFIRSCSFLALFGFLLGLHYWIQDRRRLDQALNMLFLLVCIYTIMNVISPFVFPERSWHWITENRFQGLLTHPNMMGIFCMLSYPVLLWKYSTSNQRVKWMVLVFIGTLFILHILTGSRSTILGAVFGISCWFFVLKQRLKLVLLLFVLSLSGMLLMTSTIVNKSMKRKTDYGDSITTLTGRQEIWIASYMLIMNKPILGYGYGVAGKVFGDLRFYNPELPFWSGTARASLHNGYFSTAIGVGIVGSVFWLLLLYIPLRRSISFFSSPYKAFVISIMSMCLLVNFVESVITGGNSLASVFFWITWVASGRLKQTDNVDNRFHLIRTPETSTI